MSATRVWTNLRGPTSIGPVLTANFDSQPVLVERFGIFVVRSPLAGAESLLSQIRQAVWSVDANLPLAGVYTMNHYYKGSMARASFTLVMLGIAGAMALILGAVGLYGVIAYSVSQRTREIGIRVALGAERRHVLSLVLTEGMFVVIAGLAIGLAASLIVTRFLASLLFGVSPTDPLTFASVAARTRRRRARGVLPTRAPRHAYRSDAGAALRIARSRSRSNGLSSAAVREWPPVREEFASTTFSAVSILPRADYGASALARRPSIRNMAKSVASGLAASCRIISEI